MPATFLHHGVRHERNDVSKKTRGAVRPLPLQVLERVREYYWNLPMMPQVGRAVLVSGA